MSPLNVLQSNDKTQIETESFAARTIADESPQSRSSASSLTNTIIILVFTKDSIIALTGDNNAQDSIRTVGQNVAVSSLLGSC